MSASRCQQTILSQLRAATRVRALFERHGLAIQGWDKVRTDVLTIREAPHVAPAQQRRSV